MIVGFPGETAAEFEESLAFVERMGFARPHVFTYSPRDGTRAATLPDQVPPAEKKARVKRMLAVARDSERRFWRRHLGATLEVVWEERKRERWSGLSDNYIRVYAEDGRDRDLAGTLGRVELRAITDGGVLGIPVTGASGL